MEKEWYHKNYAIKDGLKPGSKHFQYFYVVSEKGATKCHYCVWITDDALSRFDPYQDFDSIISAHREAWNQWVMEKIDLGALESTVLKIDRDGESEIALADMPEHFVL